MITINEQSSVRLELDKIIYVDPLHLKEELHDADIILITHSHWDHLSIEDILKCKNENTVIVTVGDSYGTLSSYFSKENLILTKPNETFSVLGIEIQTMPAYNINKEYHLEEYQWVGYILTLKNQRYYIMGDTDALAFMKDISCDYLLIPIGGKFTMNVEEAVKLTKAIHPSVVIPIHYGTIVGDSSLGEDFKKQMPSDIECQLLIKF